MQTSVAADDIVFVSLEAREISSIHHIVRKIDRKTDFSR